MYLFCYYATNATADKVHAVKVYCLLLSFVRATRLAAHPSASTHSHFIVYCVKMFITKTKDKCCITEELLGASDEDRF